jgi:hypothetical protein
VNAYWNSLAAGGVAAPVDLDRELIDLIDAVAKSDSAPAPDRTFVDRLEVRLMGHDIWNAIPVQDVNVESIRDSSSDTSAMSRSTGVRRPIAGESSWPSWLKTGLSWFTAQAAFVVLLLIIAGGLVSIYLINGNWDEDERVIPAVVDSVDEEPPAGENVVLPLAGAEVYPDLISPEGAEYWAAGNFSLVELEPGQANGIGLCPDCQNLTFIFVMDGQLGVDINGPILRVAENWEAIEQWTTGKIQLQAGDAAIFDLHSVYAPGRIVPSNVHTRLLMGVLSIYATSFATQPTMFTTDRQLPSMAVGPLGLSLEEITIGPRSLFALEVSDCRTELYLLSSGNLSALAEAGNEPGNGLTNSWWGPAGMQVDQYPPGTYFFQNLGSEPAQLYRLSITHPAVSDATPRSC